MEAQLAALKATVEAGFVAINRRLDDQSDTQRDRHEENVERLERIEGDVKITNGRVTKLEAYYETLRHRVESIAQGVHDKVNRLWKRLGELAPEAGIDVASRPVTFSSLGAVSGAIVATVVATYLALLALGFHR